MCQVYQVHKGGQLNQAVAVVVARLPAAKEVVMVVVYVYVHVQRTQEMAVAAEEKAVKAAKAVLAAGEVVAVLPSTGLIPVQVRHFPVYS